MSSTILPNKFGDEPWAQGVAVAGDHRGQFTFSLPPGKYRGQLQGYWDYSRQGRLRHGRAGLEIMIDEAGVQ